MLRHIYMCVCVWHMFGGLIFINIAGNAVMLLGHSKLQLRGMLAYLYWQLYKIYLKKDKISGVYYFFMYNYFIIRINEILNSNLYLSMLINIALLMGAYYSRCLER